MPPFRSADEFFESVTALLARLEDGRHWRAVDELRDGLRHLNGLTDGWALFLGSIDKVQATDSGRIAPDDREALERIRSAVNSAVYRR